MTARRCGLAALSMMWALLVAGVGMRMAYRRATRPSEKLERSGKPALHLVLRQRAKVCRCARRCRVRSRVRIPVNIHCSV